jgi:hypothetical protein
MTPTTFSERESLVNVRPTTDGSPPPEHDHVGSAGVKIGVREGATQQGRHPQCLEHTTGDRDATYLFRAVGGGDIEWEGLKDAETFEALIVFRVGHVHRRGFRHIRDAPAGAGSVRGTGCPRQHADERFGLGIGQRIDQDAVHHAEHGRVGADGQRQCEQHGDRERRIPAEPSSRLTQMKIRQRLQMHAI